ARNEKSARRYAMRSCKLEVEKRSALRELEAAACLGATVLLALDGTTVTGEEATLLKHAAKLGLVVGKSLGDAVSHSAGLTRKTAPFHGGENVVLVDPVGGMKRLF